ncbi:hypothetical protein BN946_scf185043.g19 [Trametes cinnabarina]|uniref:Uncharacterized protein n=1 Tax=Pycnoporus cinnabarinus TaxID=5643 RepID=A0A060SHU5_PYCCI|nr:hypothetical protein BN946_scf185043.g19 [Trametes cinnabarina]
MSHPEDEPVAISSLLGVDARSFIHLPSTEERMRALLLQVGTFNRALLMNGWWCERLVLKNFSWAPASLSNVLWPGPDTDLRMATCTEEGAFGEFSIVHFTPVLLGINYGVVVVMDESNESGIVSTAKPGTGGTSLTKLGLCQIFRLMLSPYLFRLHDVQTLVINAILLTHSVCAQKLDGGGVAAVVANIPDGDAPSARSHVDTPLHCRFVTIGSATDRMPDVAETMHSRNYWVHVAGHEIVSGKVRIT